MPASETLDFIDLEPGYNCFRGRVLKGRSPRNGGDVGGDTRDSLVNRATLVIFELSASILVRAVRGGRGRGVRRETIEASLALPGLWTLGFSIEKGTRPGNWQRTKASVDV